MAPPHPTEATFTAFIRRCGPFIAIALELRVEGTFPPRVGFVEHPGLDGRREAAVVPFPFEVANVRNTALSIARYFIAQLTTHNNFREKTNQRMIFEGRPVDWWWVSCLASELTSNDIRGPREQVDLNISTPDLEHSSIFISSSTMPCRDIPSATSQGNERPS